MAMAAARAVLKHLKSQGPQLQYKLNERAAELVGKLNGIFQENEAPIQLAHFGSFFGPAALDQVDRNMAEINPISYYLLNRGVLIQERGFLSTAHSDDDIGYFVRCVKDGVEAMRTAGLLP